MLFMLKVRIEITGRSPDNLRNRLAKEIETILAAKAAGKVLGMYKVAGRKLLVAIIDADSHDELDRYIANLPMAPFLEVEEILPLREYEAVAEEMKQRLQ